MNWLDGDDDADLGDTRQLITVHQLLKREGFRPIRSRVNRRTLTGLAVFAFGAMVGGVLLNNPIGTTLASGSAADVPSDSAQHPVARIDPSARSAIENGTTAAIPDIPPVPVAPTVPGQPGLAVTPPSMSISWTKPRSAPSGLSPRLPVVAAVVAPVASVVAPVAPVVTPVVAPVMPVLASAGMFSSVTQQQFSWFYSGAVNSPDRSGGASHCGGGR